MDPHFIALVPTTSISECTMIYTMARDTPTLDGVRGIEWKSSIKSWWMKISLPLRLLFSQRLIMAIDLSLSAGTRMTQLLSHQAPVSQRCLHHRALPHHPMLRCRLTSKGASSRSQERHQRKNPWLNAHVDRHERNEICGDS